VQTRPLLIWETEALERIVASGPRGISFRDAVALYEPEDEYAADYVLAVIVSILAHNDGTCGDDCPVPSGALVDLDIESPRRIWCRVTEGACSETGLSQAMWARLRGLTIGVEMMAGLVTEHIVRATDVSTRRGEGACLADEASAEYQGFLAECHEIRHVLSAKIPRRIIDASVCGEDPSDDMARFAASLTTSVVATLIDGPALSVQNGLVAGVCWTGSGAILTLARRTDPLLAYGSEPLDLVEMCLTCGDGFEALVREISLRVTAGLEDLAAIWRATPPG